MIAGIFKLLMFYLLYLAVKNLVKGYFGYKQVKETMAQGMGNSRGANKHQDFSGTKPPQTNKQDVEVDFRVID